MIKISILFNLLFVGSSVTELNWWPSVNIPGTVSASYSILKVVINILPLTIICVTPALNKTKNKNKQITFLLSHEQLSENDSYADIQTPETVQKGKETRRQR